MYIKLWSSNTNYRKLQDVYETKIKTSGSLEVNKLNKKIGHKKYQMFKRKDKIIL